MDQASELRELVRQDAAHLGVPADAPHMIAVASGKGGVGTTTIAVKLAVALAELGRRVVLVDADFDGADVGNLCRIYGEASIADVLKGSRSVHETLCRGPSGVQVLPGAWTGQSTDDCTPMAQERLIAALRGLGAHADDVVLDVGTGVSRVNRRFWHAGDKVVAVTTSDDVAVMNTYAAIKLLAAPDPQLPVYALINRQSDTAVAVEVYQRLSRACQRFLGRPLHDGGALPEADEVTFAATPGIEQLAQKLMAPRAEPPAPRMLERLWQRAAMLSASPRLHATRSSASRG